jgi:hypothetical protein
VTDDQLAADERLVIEAMGATILRRLAAALRDAKEGALNESLVIRLDASRGGAAQWTIRREMAERLSFQRRKRA